MAPRKKLQKAISSVSEIIKTRDERIITLSFCALLCNGHILFEDLPGTGKTTLAIAMARLMGCEFQRIQFTNDIMPSDLVGTEIFRREEEDFTLRKGPIFTNILLADEINRATPRAQSALLEAMGERQVTIGQQTLILPAPFFVLATQNPMDLHGTYPLPESQLDRFFMRLALGYPPRSEEGAIIMDNGHYQQAIELDPALDRTSIEQLQHEVNEVTMSEKIVDYILDIAERSRHADAFAFGLSTRGTIALKQAAQAYAYISGRNYVVPDDVKEVFPAVSYHRLQPSGEVKSNERSAYLEHFLNGIETPL